MHWKLFSLCVAAGLFVALGLRSTGSPTEPAREPAPAPTGLLVDLGNTNCPVMEGEVDNKTFVEWNHLRVGFCCDGCQQRFLKSPERHLDEAGVDWRAAHEAVQAYLKAEAPHKAHRLAEIRKRWKVVRDE